MQHGLRLFFLGDVPQDRCEQVDPLLVHLRHRHSHGEASPVKPLTQQLLHRPCCLLQERCHLPLQRSRPVLLHNQITEARPHRLPRVQPKHPPRAGVNQLQPPCGVGGDDGVEGAVHDGRGAPLLCLNLRQSILLPANIAHYNCKKCHPGARCLTY